MKIQRKIFWLMIFTASLLIAMMFINKTLLLTQANTRYANSAPPDHIRLGAEKGLLASTVWIAEHNGYFADQGLDIKITEFPSGRAAITRMLGSKDIDIATVAQTPVVLNSHERNDFHIIAGMVRAPNDVKILARKDRNINQPRDLKGKKIGITKGSTGHYFLSLFLSQNGLRLSDTETVNIEASGISEAMVTGSVDAIATWEPHIYNAQKSLVGNAAVFESSGTFREDFYFVTFKEWTKENPELAKKFLRAIDTANTFIAQYPAASQKIIAQRLSIDLAFVTAVWGNYDFSLFLDQAILLTLEQQSRWMLSNKILQKATPQNYLDFIYFDALEHVKKDSITIFR